MGSQISQLLSVGLGATMLFFATLPATSNYTLNNYSFGSGGTADSTTSNYALEGITGEANGLPSSTSNYYVKPGFIQTEQANVPTMTLSNPSNDYDKLQFVINAQGNNLTTALFALQVSTTSNFSSNVSYVQTDDTLSPTLTLGDYQTYSAWGGASGQYMIGLAANTAYYLRAKVTVGKFTESAYGPSASANTVAQQLSYCIYTNGSCGSGGNSVAFGNMPPTTVTSSPNQIGVDFATNADSGGNVYVYSMNGGLKSSSANYTITSSTADLSTVSAGFGAQISSVSQSSGGPLTGDAPYNGSNSNVGDLSTSIATILSSSNPLVGGSSSIGLKVLPSSTTPSATDYADTLTLISAANF